MKPPIPFLIVLIIFLNCIKAFCADEPTQSSTFKEKLLERINKTRTLAETGNTEAQFELAEIFFSPHPLYPHDRKEAFIWYRMAAESGHSESQYQTSLFYEYGWAGENSPVEALKWLRKAAEQGNAEAQFRLGLKFAIGEVVLQDYQEALKWYTKAAEQGDSHHQLNLGMEYEGGKIVSKDYKEALKWYTKAAEQGSSAAQWKAGTVSMLMKNYVEAHKWFNIASQGPLPFENAVEWREKVSQKMTHEQIADAQKRAKEWVEKQ